MNDGDIMVNYRELSEAEITKALFFRFIRRQEVTDVWRRENGELVIKSEPFIDDWSAEDYDFLVKCLRHTVSSGGFVYGAFADGSLKGFVSVEAEPFGGENRYLDLSSIHVSADMRGGGIGRVLFGAACEWAKSHGAFKLYISSHSAVETQGFYKSMGCTEAVFYNKEHVEKEPFDVQLEREL